MSNVYQSFLKAPSTSSLAPNAALHYITSTSSIRGPEAIIKHLQAQEKKVQKQDEKILSSTESSDGVVLETETTFKFVGGGGLILPQMDDNMLVDMVAILPVVHIVQLDNNGKISQIRLHWDQATVLKQVEAIGKSGRNWPIKAGSEQTKLIADSVKAVGQQGASAGSGFSSERSAQPAGAQPTGAKPAGAKGNSDYTSRLFATGDENEGRSAYNGPAVERRSLARPQERQWNEDYSGQNAYEGEDHSNDKKVGGGRNHQTNRLFDTAETEERPGATHFSSGKQRSSNPKNGAWDMHDSATPEKAAPRTQREQQRHFGHGIDEDAQDTPPKRPIVHAARPDSKAHFTIADQSSPAPQAHHEVAPVGKQPLGSVTNVNNNRRAQDGNPHFDMNDNSPATKTGQAENARRGGASKARNEMEVNWDFDETPIKTSKIYKTAGDGMGGRAGARNWSIGDEEEDSNALTNNAYGGKSGQKQVYKTYGNGMGGRKDTGLTWGIGDN